MICPECERPMHWNKSIRMFECGKHGLFEDNRDFTDEEYDKMKELQDEEEE